jgi:hypothetical protein
VSAEAVTREHVVPVRSARGSQQSVPLAARGPAKSLTREVWCRVVQDVVRTPGNSRWNSSVVRAFVLLETLVEGGCDAERPPRNEKVVRSIRAEAGCTHFLARLIDSRDFLLVAHVRRPRL